MTVSPEALERGQNGFKVNRFFGKKSLMLFFARAIFLIELLPGIAVVNWTKSVVAIGRRRFADEGEKQKHSNEWSVN